jgi:MATE family multidrug resistance protein
MIASWGETEMAAHQIALQVVHFSFLPAFAVAEAASVLAGQAVGAGRDNLVLVVARQALLTASAYTGACTLIIAALAPLIVSGFTGDVALAAAAVRLLHVGAVFQVFDGANVVARATLRGTGDVRMAAVVGVVTSWALTPPLGWLLGVKLHLAAYGGWLGLCAEIIVGALILWWRLERRHWTRAAQLSRDALVYSKVASTGA